MIHRLNTYFKFSNKRAPLNNNINDYNYNCNLNNHGIIKFIILNSIFYAKGLFIFRGAL